MAVDIEIQQAGTWPTYRLTLTRGADPLPLAGATAHLTAESTFWRLQPGVNIVTFSAPSGSVEVAIEYASRYTGV